LKKKFEVKINYNWCKKCGLCSWICPTNAIVEDELRKPLVNNEKCIGCFQCENICPDFAIDVVMKESVRSESDG